MEKLTEYTNLFATVKRVKEMRHSELIMSCHVKLHTGQKCRLQSSYNLITTCSSVLPALLRCVQIFHWSRKPDNSCNNSDFIGFSGSLKGKDTKMGLVVMLSPKTRTGRFKDYFSFIGFITPF